MFLLGYIDFKYGGLITQAIPISKKICFDGIGIKRIDFSCTCIKRVDFDVEIKTDC